MTRGHTPPGRSRRRLIGVLAGLVIVLAAGAGVRSRPAAAESVWSLLKADAAAPLTIDTGPTVRGPKYWEFDELSFKADLFDALPYKPQLIVLGGSRSRRYEPQYIQQRTGVTGFNFGTQNARPQEAWGIVNYVHARFRSVRPRYLWLIHPRFLRDWFHVSPPLVQDRRFFTYFPASFLQEQRARMPHSPDALPGPPKLPPSIYGRDGLMIWSHSDTLPLGQGITWAIQQWTRRNSPGTPTIDPVPKHYFEKTLKLMNALGATPVLVMSPVQPQCLAAISANGYWQVHDKLVNYLDSLQGTYDFILIDLTDVSSFGGDPLNFYDGYHPRIRNTRRVIDEILRRYPHAFD